MWSPRRLAETRSLDRASLAPREAAFLAASGTAILRRRIFGVGGAAVLVIGAVIAGLAIRARARYELEAVLADQVHAATAAQEVARQIAAQRDVARNCAFKWFDANRWNDGEDAWTQVEALAAREERQYRIASGDLESVLLLDSTRPGLRDRFADLTFERLLRAESDRHLDLADELAARMAAYDDGRRQAALGAEARVALEVTPAGTKVWSERPVGSLQLVGQAPLPALTLPPGSVVLSFEAPGRVAARLPVLLPRGQTLRGVDCQSASRGQRRQRQRGMSATRIETSGSSVGRSTSPSRNVWTLAYLPLLGVVWTSTVAVFTSTIQYSGTPASA